MLEGLASYLDNGNFSPHGYCFFWSPALLWTYVVSDLTIAASYFSIPFALWYFVQKRPDVPFRWVFIMFGVFVLACGTTHLLALWNIWHVDYWADAAVKAFTASVSVATAILLWPLIPKALTIPSHTQLESANRKLQTEVVLRAQAEGALRVLNDNLERRVAERTAEVHAREAELRRFRMAMDVISDAIYLVDRPSMRFIDINAAACAMREQTRAELLALGPEGVLSIPRAELERQYDSIIAGSAATEPIVITRKRADGTQVALELRRHAQQSDEGWTIVTVVRDITAQKRAEDQLRTRELRYRAVTDSSSDAFVTSDGAGKISGWNPSAERLFGYSEAEIVGQPLTLLIPQRFQERHLDGMKRVQSSGERRVIGKTVEVAGRRKDATEFPLELSLSAWKIGESQFFTGIIRDITERKAAERKIERLSKLYAALSQCNEAIVRCASENELLPQICGAAVNFGGMKMAWIGLLDSDTRMIRPIARFGEDADEYLQGIEISVDAESPLGRGPTGIAIRENRPVWLQDFLNEPATAPWHERRARFGWGASATLPLNRNGVPVGIFVLYAAETDAFDEAARRLLIEMAADIGFALDNFSREAARTRAERDLRTAEEQFRGLVEQSIAGTYIVQDGKFAYVNPRYAEILGYGSADELIGRDFLSIIVEKDRGVATENVRRRIEGEIDTISYEFTALRKDGSTVDIGVHGARASHRGRPAVIGLIQDISEKKRAEAEITRYVEQLRVAFMSTVEVATTLSEMRDPYTAGHERRVAEIAVALGAELGLDERRQEGLRVAGHLHDIGKITIPAEILSKPGKLSALELKLVQAHAQAGYDVLKSVEFPWPVAQVALQHHERMDGSGYPQGLKGEAIVIEARIMAVADVVEAMSSHRPYRPGLGIDKALAEIERGRGTAFDPVVVDACLTLFHEKGYTIPA